MRKRRVLSFLIVIMIGMIFGAIYFVNFYYEKPERVVTRALDSVIAQDMETAEIYLDYWQLYGGHSEKKIYQAVLRDFNYEIKNVTQSGAEAVAELSVSNRDMEAIYGQFVVDAYQLVISDAYQPEEERMGEEMLKQKIDEMLMSALTDSETEIRSSDINVDMTRRGRSWYINFDHEDLDAIYGGYLSAQEAADNVLGDRSAEALANLEEAYQRNIDDARHVLRNAVHYMVDDVWNSVLCNIVSCINAGTDLNGEDYDIEEGMAELEELLKDREEYDTYIAALDDVNYGDIKLGWNNLTDACDALVQELKERQPEPVDFDYIPDTSGFEDAMFYFVQLVYPKE